MKIGKLIKRTSLAIAALVVILLLGGFTYEQISRSGAEWSVVPEGEMIDVGGHSLHVIKQGDSGATIVFEAGLDWYGHLSWYKVEKAVSRFATTVSYDRAGVLWSERGSEPKTGEAMANDLDALLNKVGVFGPYIVVGHSLAGITTRTFISNHGDNIAGVVLVDASHPEQINRLPEGLTPTIPPWLVDIANSFGVVRLFFPEAFPNTDVSDRMNTVSSALVHRSLGALADEYHSVDNLSEEARKITSYGDIPVTVITGTAPDRYDFIPLEIRDDMERIWNELQKELLMLSTDSQQVLAPKSGHYVQIYQPEIVVEAIRDMVERLENN